MKAGTPIGVRSAIVSIADGAALLNGPKIKNDKVFIVMRTPAAVVRLIDAGVEIKKVIIGNMRMEEGKKKVTSFVGVNQEDWDAFKELDSRKVELLAQWLPGEDSKNFNEILKKQDFNAL
jgi:mannose/fructose/N-acetylgalactosamine-specific phosphotransferase system component IIB